VGLTRRAFWVEDDSCAASHLTTRKFSAAGPNPEGIVSSSPGLRAASYPGKRWLATVNPNGVAAPRGGTMGATPLGLMPNFAANPG
jgi:hypothetical protein